MRDKIDMKELEKQITAYSEIRPVYETFAEIMAEILKHALKELGMEGIVQARAKGVPNFAEKAIRKRDKYPRPSEQFTDLCGARVILDCKDDIEPICAFVRKHFEIDEANSEDVVVRLGVSQFGYRSIHFIVSLKKGDSEELLDKMKRRKHSESERNAFATALSHLYDRRSAEEVAGGLVPGPVFKAEIQLRTLLQHAWAVLSHDRVYKTEFKVPPILVRDLNRTAATLEEADNAFARTIRGVEEYRTNYGAYMAPDKRRSELVILEAILVHDPENRKMAHKMAQLWQSLEEWDKARNAMQPFVDRWMHSSQGQLLVKTVDELGKAGESSVKAELSRRLEQLHDTEMSRILHEYGLNLWRTGKKDATGYLEWGIALDPANDDARVSLAEVHLDKDVDEALPFFMSAYKANPGNPRALSGLLHCKVVIERNLEFIELLRPSLEAAVSWSWKCARIGVNLPYAYYDIGLFSVFLHQPCQSLAAFGKAVQLTESVSLINDNLERIAELRKRVSRDLPELDWIHTFLVLARAVKAKKLDNERKELGLQIDTASTDSYVDALRKLASGRRPEFSLPLVIVAGGCDESVKGNIGEFRSILEKSFIRFNGTVISGGTTAGIPGLVGELPDPQDGRINKVAYLPKSIPSWAHPHPAYKICPTAGNGFTPLDSLQAWIDIIISGIEPEQVRLLGINGGELSDCEFKLALSLGAKAGVVPRTGRASARIAENEDWNRHPNLLLLPDDLHSIRIFIEGPPKTMLDEEVRERMARDAHEEYRRNQMKRHIGKDPAMSEWEDLPESLKRDNLYQVDYIEEKLRAVGLSIRKLQGEKPGIMQLTPDQVEIMAEVEHGRWNVDRLLEGWRLGERNVDEKTTPYIVSWSELPESVKEWDRQAVMRIPEQLRQNGYEITPNQALDR